MTSQFKTGFYAAALLSFLATAAIAAHHTLAERINSDARSAEDRARDAGRKPAQVLEFLGVEAGMDVIDIMAAGGWYTEVLSHAVGEDGSVAAHNTPAMLQFRDGANDQAMAERTVWIGLTLHHPDLAPLRADPRFTAVLERMGLRGEREDQGSP